MKIHEICWILDIDESNSTTIFGARWPNPPLARTSHVLNILTGRVTLHPKPSKTDITGISWIFSSNSGKAPKNGRLSRPALCCDFSVQNVPWLAEAVASHQINRGCSQLAAACIWGAACEIPMVLFTQLYTASNYIPLEKYKHLQDSQTWYCLIDAGETKLLGGDHFWRLGNVGFDYGQLAGHTTFPCCHKIHGPDRIRWWLVLNAADHIPHPFKNV